MAEEVYTTLGTRILMLADGGSVLVTRDESELVKLSVQTPDKRRIELPLTATDCLSLIEFLSVAARPGSGRPLVDVQVEPDALPASASQDSAGRSRRCWNCGVELLSHARSCWNCARC